MSNVTVRVCPLDGLQRSPLPVKKPTLPAGTAGSPFDWLVGLNELHFCFKARNIKKPTLTMAAQNSTRCKQHIKLIQQHIN
jgi:hypothetical protein